MLTIHPLQGALHFGTARDITKATEKLQIFLMAYYI